MPAALFHVPVIPCRHAITIVNHRPGMHWNAPMLQCEATASRKPSPLPDLPGRSQKPGSCRLRWGGGVEKGRAPFEALERFESRCWAEALEVLEHELRLPPGSRGLPLLTHARRFLESFWLMRTLWHGCFISGRPLHLALWHLEILAPPRCRPSQLAPTTGELHSAAATAEARNIRSPPQISTSSRMRRLREEPRP